MNPISVRVFFLLTGCIYRYGSRPFSTLQNIWVYREIPEYR